MGDDMGNRYLECLALVLQEETSYPQKPGGPYIRKLKRRDGKIVATAVYDETLDGLVWSDRTRSEIPTKHDGCAYDDDPNDTGGRTCMGILQREYDAWRTVRGLAKQDVWRIADREIEAIFEPQYWQPLRCGEMPAGVDYFLVDFGFACGIGKAAEKLQRALGVKVDRHVGVGTVDAAHRADPGALLEVLAAERESYYRACRTFWAHGKGWLVRNKRVTARALAMVEHSAAPSTMTALAIEEQKPTPETPTPPAAISRDSGADKTAATSGTVKASVGTGALGGLALLGQVNQAAAETKNSGLMDMLARLASDPMFWTYAAIMLLAAYIFRERIRKIITDGI
jgi:lysozyme family protein